MALKTPFLTGLLDLIPEDQRGKVTTELEALENGQLRQEEFSRLSDQTAGEKARAQKLYDDNVAWFDAKKAELAELDSLKADIAAGKLKRDGADAARVAPTAVTKEEFEQTMANTERGALGFIADATLLSVKHMAEFGEVLDIRELLADKRISQLGVQAIYADKFKDRIQKKASDAQAARDETLRKEGETRAREAMRTQVGPYPVRGNEPSTLDNLELSKDKAPAVKSVAEMAGEYDRLNSVRVGSGA